MSTERKDPRRSQRGKKPGSRIGSFKKGHKPMGAAAKGSKRKRGRPPKAKAGSTFTAEVEARALAGCESQDIIDELGVTIDETNRAEFEAILKRGHAAHRNWMLGELRKQSEKGRTSAVKSLAEAFLARFRGVEEDFNEAELLQRAEIAFETALKEEKAAKDV